MMWRIIEHSHGYPLKNQKIILPNEYPYASCSQGKLIVMPSFSKVTYESPVFLERIHWDICESIHPSCRPFRYFMVLIDVSTRWSCVYLLSTRNVSFSRILAQIIKLRAQFSNYPIKTFILDNAYEFTTQTFIAFYYLSVGIINVEHPISHTHTQNSLT